jgi:hypothetical protein
MPDARAITTLERERDVPRVGREPPVYSVFPEGDYLL